MRLQRCRNVELGATIFSDLCFVVEESPVTNEASQAFAHAFHSESPGVYRGNKPSSVF